MRYATPIVAALLLAAACAPAQPEWSSGHPADPDAPVGAEAPVAEVLSADPPPAPEAEPGGHHGHHGAPQPEESEDDATTETNDAE